MLDHIPSITYPTRLWLGHTSGRLVNEIPILLKEKRYAIAAAAIITYGGLLGIVLALTVASVVVPIFVNHDWQELAWAMSVVYAVVFVLLAASYKSTFGINIDTMDEWAKSAHSVVSRSVQDSARLSRNEAERPGASSTRQVPL